MIKCAILTISDRSFRGIRPDLSGPALQTLLEAQNWLVSGMRIVPDDLHLIAETLMEWADSDQHNLILTTGGTGFAPRDVTPEATLSVIQRLAPGLAEGMRLSSLQKTPHAMLTRGVCGIRGRALVINLPGSPKAAVENLEAILPVLPHAIELLLDSSESESHHQFPA